MTRSKDIDEVMERAAVSVRAAVIHGWHDAPIGPEQLNALLTHIRAQEEEIGRLKAQLKDKQS